MKKALFSLSILSLPLAAFAHDGHGYFAGHNPAHYLASPAHLIPIAFAVFCLGLLAWRRVNAK